MLFSIPQSQADILFIDLNHSEAEYQTILAETKKKYEKVIRIPAVDEKKYKIWDKATTELRKINFLSWEQQQKFSSQYGLLSDAVPRCTPAAEPSERKKAVRY